MVLPLYNCCKHTVYFKSIQISDVGEFLGQIAPEYNNSFYLRDWGNVASFDTNDEELITLLKIKFITL